MWQLVSFHCLVSAGQGGRFCEAVLVSKHPALKQNLNFKPELSHWHKCLKIVAQELCLKRDPVAWQWWKRAGQSHFAFYSVWRWHVVGTIYPVDLELFAMSLLCSWHCSSIGKSRLGKLAALCQVTAFFFCLRVVWIIVPCCERGPGFRSAPSDAGGLCHDW